VNYGLLSPLRSHPPATLRGARPARTAAAAGGRNPSQPRGTGAACALGRFLRQRSVSWRVTWRRDIAAVLNVIHRGIWRGGWAVAAGGSTAWSGDVCLPLRRLRLPARSPAEQGAEGKGTDGSRKENLAYRSWGWFFPEPNNHMFWFKNTHTRTADDGRVAVSVENFPVSWRLGNRRRRVDASRQQRLPAGRRERREQVREPLALGVRAGMPQRWESGGEGAAAFPPVRLQEHVAFSGASCPSSKAKVCWFLLWRFTAGSSFPWRCCPLPLWAAITKRWLRWKATGWRGNSQRNGFLTPPANEKPNWTLRNKRSWEAWNSWSSCLRITPSECRRGRRAFAPASAQLNIYTWEGKRSGDKE